MAPQPLLPRRHAPQHNTAGASHNAGTANTAFRVVHAVASLTLALLTWRIVARPPGDVASSRCAAAAAECPATCRLHGRCVAGSCVCDEGYWGTDCSFAWCPNECSGRGECVGGACLCKAQYGGTDCSVDRLEVLGNELLERVVEDLEAGTRSDAGCPFLTQRDVQKSGGDHVVYRQGDEVEVYSVPEEMFVKLPEKCPTLTYRKCAIVGNSGTLRYAKPAFGAEIEQHDMVYRFNQAPTHDFSTWVGNRTTYESLNAKFAHSLAKDEAGWRWRDPLATYVLFEPLKLKDTFISIREKYPYVNVLLFSPQFFVRAHMIYDRLQSSLERHEFGCFLGEKPMSGLYGILFNLAVCESVDMYGFDPWTDNLAGQKMRYHYFDNEEPRRGAHSFDATYYMYLLMSRTFPHMRIHNATAPLMPPRARRRHRDEEEEEEEEEENA
ncbi:alpha-N-acetyl-neuraminate alpha-2,8-sialyltransferase [Pycnococcus provasolii]